jgi:hypothetical protein
MRYYPLFSFQMENRWRIPRKFCQKNEGKLVIDSTAHSNSNPNWDSGDAKVKAGKNNKKK